MTHRNPNYSNTPQANALRTIRISLASWFGMAVLSILAAFAMSAVSDLAQTQVVFGVVASLPALLIPITIILCERTTASMIAIGDPASPRWGQSNRLRTLRIVLCALIVVIAFAMVVVFIYAMKRSSAGSPELILPSVLIVYCGSILACSYCIGGCKAILRIWPAR